MKTVRDPRYDQAMKQARRANARWEKIAPLLEAAHEAGDERATYAVATWYLHGRFFKKDVRKGVELLREAADRDHPDALFDLANCYEGGKGARKSERKAAQLYLRAALLGEKQSVYELGRCYYYGIGVKTDRAVADIWLERAEELGIVD